MEPIYYNLIMGRYSSDKYYHHINKRCEIQPSFQPRMAITYLESFNEERCVVCGKKGIPKDRNYNTTDKELSK